MNALSGNSADTAQQIRLYGITKTYGPFFALNNVDLNIAPGEFITLLGPSGSGKSTLLMSLAGFVEPSDGNIFMGKTSIISLAPEKRDFGVVFQGYALFPHMTVGENVAYPLKIRRVQSVEIATKVQQTLALVQLEHLAERYPRQLSGGQQQRVALARALVFSPKVLLLDEPMGALDKNLRQDLQIELRQLHRRLGRTFVNVTHDQEEAMAMSDRIAIMRDGRIVQIGDPRSLYDAPKSRFVAAFLGKSNFIEGRIESVDGPALTISTADGFVRHAGAVPSDKLEAGSAIMLALRPQKIAFGPGLNSRRVRVESAIFLGTHVDFTLRCNSNLQIAAQLSPLEGSALPAEGEEIEISWNPSDSVIVRAD